MLEFFVEKIVKYADSILEKAIKIFLILKTRLKGAINYGM
jgi:hypothetical protein